MFQANFVQKIVALILYLITCFRKACRLWNNVIKSCTAGQATDDNMANAPSILGT